MLLLWRCVVLLLGRRLVLLMLLIVLLLLRWLILLLRWLLLVTRLRSLLIDYRGSLLRVPFLISSPRFIVTRRLRLLPGLRVVRLRRPWR